MIPNLAGEPRGPGGSDAAAPDTATTDVDAADATDIDTAGAPTARPDLRGLRILVPRAGSWGEGIAERIRRRGGVPVVAPLVRIEPPDDPGRLAAAVAELNDGAFDWLVVTSANAVAALVDAGMLNGGVERTRVAAVGPATARALRRSRIEVDLVPEADFSASGLAAALLAEVGSAPGTAPEAVPAKVLLPVSDLAGDTLEVALRAGGHSVERVTAYRTVCAAPEPQL
ncbi:MAG: uroporphyrinogen-III synthase, partial [Leucobacter sp.]